MQGSWDGRRFCTQANPPAGRGKVGTGAGSQPAREAPFRFDLSRAPLYRPGEPKSDAIA